MLDSWLIGGSQFPCFLFFSNTPHSHTAPTHWVLASELDGQQVLVGVSKDVLVSTWNDFFRTRLHTLTFPSLIFQPDSRAVNSILTSSLLLDTNSPARAVNSLLPISFSFLQTCCLSEGNHQCKKIDSSSLRGFCNTDKNRKGNHKPKEITQR